MARIALGETTVGKLKKESGGEDAVLHDLCRESMARKWLRSKGIPNWRNPATPSEDAGRTESGSPRYSILLSDGARFLVCSHPSSTLSFDTLAASKCFAVLAVALEKDCRHGSVRGCLFLRDVSRSNRSYNFSKDGLRSNSEFLDHLTVPKSYTSKLISFSARLLLFGEPDAPEWGTDGVKAFAPSYQAGKGVTFDHE
ncbi:MAG: hypothetical protein KAH54_00065 [Candidatus Sabulitectum sp.]|nr:hypothetical protein [Candidatus Sabulitectum sp.]